MILLCCMNLNHCVKDWKNAVVLSRRERINNSSYQVQKMLLQGGKYSQHVLGDWDEV